MATTTKSNRKKPAKTAKASKAAKTTKKAVSKKPAQVKTTVKASTKKPLTPIEKIKSMHVSLTLVYVVFAGIITAFVTTAATALTWAIQTKDEFASTENVVLGSAYETFCSIEPKYLLVAALAVSALSSILLATKLRARYEKTLAAGISGFRWVTFGLSASLMITYVNLLAGINDVATLKLSAGLVIVTAMLAWIAERDNVKSSAPKWLAFVLGLGAGALAWLPLAITFVGTSVYGDERFGWHVYAIAAVTLAGFTGFAINQYRQIRSKGSKKEYYAVEATYMQTDLFAKFVVVLVTLLALQ